MTEDSVDRDSLPPEDSEPGSEESAASSEAEQTMRRAQVRRLPVVDESFALVGIVSLADLSRRAASDQTGRTRDVSNSEVGDTLAAIVEPSRGESRASRGASRACPTRSGSSSTAACCRTASAWSSAGSPSASLVSFTRLVPTSPWT